MKEPLRRGPDDRPILPGPLAPGASCPPFREIVCIDVDKVFDSCSQVECEDFCLRLCQMDEWDGERHWSKRVITDCAVVDLYVANLTTEEIPGRPSYRRVTADICVFVEISGTQDGRPFTERIRTSFCFHKEVPLYMPNPRTMFPKVEVVSLECLGARYKLICGHPYLWVTLGLRAIFKSEGRVQLMVGAFGHCPVPPTCRELGTICEGFIAAPFPTIFPPEIFEVLPTVG